MQWNSADRAAVNDKPSPACEFTVEAVSDFQSFLRLQPVWNGLVEEIGIAHPFLSHDWVRTWWESFGAGKELHILAVKQGEEIIAIAPLMASRGSMYGLPMRRLEFIYNAHTPQADFIIGRWSKEAYGAIWNYIVTRQESWDVLQLCQLAAGSETLEELPRLAASDGFLIGLWRSGNSPYLPLRGTWEKYFAELDSKHRSNLRNRLKRFSRLGKVEMEVIPGGPQAPTALEDGLRIEAAAWKGKRGTAIRCQPEVRLFYGRLLERAATRGWLRFHFLTVNGCRVAFDYSLCFKNNLYLLKPGYDPSYAPYSPYNLLLSMVLHDAFAEGLGEYHFLGLEDPWKLEWTAQTRPHYWLTIFPNRLRARLLHFAKFRVIPRLARHKAYRGLRDAILVSGRRTRR
ncbi:MAG TPA: GNAT family N-acetyltransferase [Acidobacteriota bacterium]